MKNIFLISVVIFYLSFSSTFLYAQTPSPTEKPQPSVSADPENINILNDLKDKIASRVAQLNLVQKKGAIGIIQAVSGTQITITDTTGNNAIIDVDELTKFSSPSAKTSFGLSDLTKGTTVDILGLYNKQSKHILARFIDVSAQPKYIFGEVASINSDEFLISVISVDSTITQVSIETVTKISQYSNGNLQKSGFSKLQVEKQVIIIGYPDKNNPRNIIASRLLYFPDVPSNPRIIIPQQALDTDEPIVSSTGSGKKLTPITR